jgi:hypothetical protein
VFCRHYDHQTGEEANQRCCFARLRLAGSVVAVTISGCALRVQFCGCALRAAVFVQAYWHLMIGNGGGCVLARTVLRRIWCV